MIIKYLAGINLLGFLLYGLNLFVSAHTRTVRIDWAARVATVLGGSLGVLVAILIFDRKAKKENMMTRVFAICFLVMQIILFLIISGKHTAQMTFDFVGFFARHKIFAMYLVLVNLVSFVMYATDKIKAQNEKKRIPVAVLMGIALLGGAIGAIAGMYLFRHKVRQKCFTVGVPLILVTWVILIFYVMNI